jgi:hypothetical protein
MASPAARRNSRRCIAAGAESASWSEQPPQSAGTLEVVSSVIVIEVDVMSGLSLLRSRRC